MRVDDSLSGDAFTAKIAALTDGVAAARDEAGGGDVAVLVVVIARVAAADVRAEKALAR